MRMGMGKENERKFTLRSHCFPGVGEERVEVFSSRRRHEKEEESSPLFHVSPESGSREALQQQHLSLSQSDSGTRDDSGSR